MADEPTGRYGFTKMPDLQPAFMNGGQHNISKAIAELRTTVKGFLVEMPLDWGMEEIKTPSPPKTGGQTIAEYRNSSITSV